MSKEQEFVNVDKKYLMELEKKAKDYEPIKCPKCGRSDYIRSFEDWGIDDSIYKYKCINCNTYIKVEPQTEDEILREQCRAFMGIVEQTERSE